MSPPNPLTKARKRKLLIADDSITIQKLVNLTMAGTDFEVVTAFDGFDAKNKIKRLKPELVFLDAKLREISGLKLCTEIRKDKQLKNTRVILLRSNPSADEREAMAKVGPDAYLDKPFDSRALLSVIQNLAGGVEEQMEPADKIDSEDDTKKMKIPTAAPSQGPFTSFREAEKITGRDPESRLASIAAELVAGQSVTDPQGETPALSVREDPLDFTPGEVTNRIRYDDLAREEIRAWVERNLPLLAEEFLKQEITKMLSKS
jgi:DNA-binding response OmpR family regulator